MLSVLFGGGPVNVAQGGTGELSHLGEGFFRLGASGVTHGRAGDKPLAIAVAACALGLIELFRLVNRATGMPYHSHSRNSYRVPPFLCRLIYHAK